jgi:hypothetical protein
MHWLEKEMREREKARIIPYSPLAQPPYSRIEEKPSESKSPHTSQEDGKKEGNAEKESEPPRTGSPNSSLCISPPPPLKDKLPSKECVVWLSEFNRFLIQDSHIPPSLLTEHPKTKNSFILHLHSSLLPYLFWKKWMKMEEEDRDQMIQNFHIILNQTPSPDDAVASILGFHFLHFFSSLYRFFIILIVLFILFLRFFLSFSRCAYLS